MRKNWVVYLPILLILLLAFVLRLYKLDTPLLDWHSFRQADTASVTREYVKNNIDLLKPSYHDLSNIQSGLDNPNGYRMVEFPLINALIASLLKLAPTWDLVIVSRVFSAGFSLITLVSIYYLGKVWSGKKTGVLAGLIFATLPFAVFYSRAVLPEPYLLAFSTSSIAFFYHWLDKNKIWSYLACFLLLSLSFLIKPFTVFLLPVFLAIILIKKATLNYQKIIAILALGLSIAPFLAWRYWIARFPEGIPDSDWLFNSNGIRLKPAWIRWLFFERLGKLITGFGGILFLSLSLLKSNKQETGLYLSWWIGMLIYLVVIATGNVQHDYYQNLLLPIVSLTMGRGMVIAYRLLKQRLLPVFSWAAVFSFYSICLVISWQYVKGFYNVNHWEYLTAGQAANQLLPKNALVIAPAMGDTQFLFQTKRKGWPIGFEIQDKIEKGATAYLTTSKDDEAKQLKKQFTVIKETDLYLLIDLTKVKKL